MFRYRKIDYRPWPVTVALLLCAEATGAVEEVAKTFVAHFRPFTEEGYQAAIEAAREAVPLPAGMLEADMPLALGLRRNADLFARLICGWGGEVRDEAGEAIAFSPAALAELVTGPDGMAVSAGINRALTELRLGIAPQKNSLTSPPPGPALDEVRAEAATSSPTT